VRAVRELSRLEQVALGNELEPVRNVVVHRALPLAIRIAAVQAAGCLRGGRLRVEVAVDLLVLAYADVGRLLLRVLTRHFDELKGVRHERESARLAAGAVGYAAWRRVSRRLSRSVALGLISQNRPS